MDKFLRWTSIHMPLWISVVLISLLFVEYGFSFDDLSRQVLDTLKIGTVASFILLKALYYIRYRSKDHPVKLWIFDMVVVIYMILTFFDRIIPGFLGHPIYLYLGAIAIFFRELATSTQPLSRKKINPALLFVLSFLLIIILGTFALMLPRATHSGISFSDALFTSTSAVCVTGLIVVDTGSYFTSFGQVLILILIQTGGLGIMTFTSFFSYFFKGSSSFSDQLVLRDITKAEQIGNVLKTLTRIITVTFVVELLGVLVIYSLISDSNYSWNMGEIFFAVFHSVSAFCNAGFSTLSLSLMEPGFEDNYGLHMTIAVLFITGGLGFPILFNVLQYLKYRILRLINPEYGYDPWLLNINTRIIFITTASLLVGGTLCFYLLEKDNILASLDSGAQWMTAFFGAATPRTAGFNTVDTSALEVPTLMLVVFLMWIGASPGSTGGGIKTTTFAISIVNYISLARGKDRIELFRREVAAVSSQRAFAVISLSLAVIFAGSVIMMLTEPEMSLLPIVFESFSAYSTVGLSMGITPELSVASKYVLIILMFTGRVGMLTILIGLFRSVATYPYRYPVENILIT